MIRTAIKCDVCFKEKTAVNHWYIVTIRENFVLGKFAGAAFALIAWDDDAAELPAVKHVCGQEHAMALLSRWMCYGNFDENQPARDPEAKKS